MKSTSERLDANTIIIPDSRAESTDSEWVSRSHKHVWRHSGSRRMNAVYVSSGLNFFFGAWC